ncbi:MAG TPA: hypothetical protein VGN51_07635 [Acidimicrobiia bacterium]|jgi:hypothetical protein
MATTACTPYLPHWHAPTGQYAWVLSSPAESFAYAVSVATDDVRDTFALLERNGFALTAGIGRGESMGGVQVAFTRGSETIQITRDRHQWLMNLRRQEWRDGFDLDIILDTINGRDDWTCSFDELPIQLPPGVSWVEALRRAWEWLDRTSDPAPVLKAMQHRRAESMFGPLPADSSTDDARPRLHE